MVESAVVESRVGDMGDEMADELERRWDDAMEAAWSELRGRVADLLAGLQEDGTFLLEVPDEEGLVGSMPYCQAVAGEGWLRVEAVANLFLDPSQQLGDEQEAGLLGLGFEEPSEGQSDNFWIDLETREADRGAWMVVEALRRVYGVLHPLCLVGDGAPPADEPERAVERDSEPPQPAEGIRFPQSADELTAMLVTLVADGMGREVELDDDGDLPIDTERCTVYVTVGQRMPRVLIFATLVIDVADEQRALVEANLLNKSEFGLTFVAAEGRITVRRELPMTALVPADVRLELSRVLDSVDRWSADLVTRVGGRGWLDDHGPQPPMDRRAVPTEEPDERYQQALAVLRELESEERGSVDATTIARIFHGDRALLLAASKWVLGRSTRWAERGRKADEQGKAGYAKACRAQQRYHHELRGRIRAALRATVQSPAKERQEQLALFAEDEASA